jgi:hypothetical protein
MAVFANDDVVMHRDTQRARDVHHRLGHLHVGLRRGRVAGRMIVQEPASFK